MLMLAMLMRDGQDAKKETYLAVIVEGGHA
jgi:hypothetical protein